MSGVSMTGITDLTISDGAVSGTGVSGAAGIWCKWCWCQPPSAAILLPGVFRLTLVNRVIYVNVVRVLGG